MAKVPAGWTDDLKIPVCAPHTLEELVEFVLQAEARKIPADQTVAELVARFGLSEEDAGLAWDRRARLLAALRQHCLVVDTTMNTADPRRLSSDTLRRG